MEIHHILEQINCWCRFSVGSSFWLAIWERTAHAASTYSRRLDHANCSDNHENQQSWWNQGHPEDHFRLCSFVVYFHYWRWHVSSLSDPCSENKNFGILDALELQKCRKEEKKDDFNITACMNYGVASFSSKSICNPKMSMMWIRGPPTTTASFQRWTPWTGEDKRASTYLIQGQSPMVPTWLVENFRF